MVIYLRFNYGNHSKPLFAFTGNIKRNPFSQGEKSFNNYASTELSADEQDKCNGDTHLKTRPIRKGDRVINY